MAVKQQRDAGPQRLQYSPSGDYPLDLEIFSVANLRRRIGMARLGTTHRYSFHVLVGITRGHCQQMVDFRPVPCESGTLLVLRPGQTHSFGPEEDWDGWMVLFRPEFLPPAPAVIEPNLLVALARLPEQLRLDEDELRTATAAIGQMREDAGIEAPPKEVHALLRHQLSALLLRLGLFHRRQAAQVGASASARDLQRFKNFRQLVEKNYPRWHQVAEYARHLGCAEKSLTRATLAAAGMTAKAFIAARINLEAKRLLAHTELSVTRIAETLGFDEATNFIKFFKRDTGCTPAAFRRLQGAA